MESVLSSFMTWEIGRGKKCKTSGIESGPSSMEVHGRL